MICFPEIVIERPSYSTNRHTRWTWGVYQPDAHWAELAAGDGDNQQQCLDRATSALYRLLTTDPLYSEYRLEAENGLIGEMFYDTTRNRKKVLT